MEVPSTSPPNRPRMTYDVFISFRGEDTRNNFVGFLYKALRQLGIMTFMDDKKLLIGDNLSEKLVKAIEESRSSIVVLSKDYASSKWCLKELAKIMDCMAETTHRVLPVFYHVDPSHVRHQSGDFKKSFDEHEEKAQKLIGEQKEEYLEEIRNWKDSMTKIGNLAGEVVTQHSSQADIIDKITEQIFERWRPKIVTLDKNLVGMTHTLQKMNVQLGLGLDDVRFMGIVGMGGIGKTKIAEVVYDCIKSKFECNCFLRVFGGSSKQINLVSLQEQLLSRLFLKENIRIWDEDYGAEMIEKQLCSRKVLLILDGVEEKEQLEMLARSPDWFGPGSRIIITTRNKEVLHQLYEIIEYKVKLLDANSALQLFCNYAFGVAHVDRNLIDLSKEMVERLGGLPLALKVIGSYLNKKNGIVWKETLNRLIKVKEERLFEVLKISYDGLGAESQKVFLDLACFFNGRRLDKVIEILESFGYNPHSELHLFIEKCLIEDSHSKIIMHDLIVALGQEIVRKESLTQLGKQSRIWLQEDVVRVFTVKHGLKYTEGIVLNLEKKQKDLILEAKLLADMTCLRILEISNVQLSGNIKSLSNILGLLNWPGYPSKCLPSNFQSGYLHELHLRHSSIVRIWHGKKEFENLKVIDVSDSEYLLETPDFSKVPKLERLVLRNCSRLYHIHPSINSLHHLIFLDLTECSSFKSFSSNLGCKNLEHLVLSKSGITSFPEIESNMEHLRELHLDETPIKQLHSSIECLVGLIVLDLRNCIMLSSLPDEVGNLKSLKALFLGGCVNLDQIPPSLGNAECLQYLYMGNTSICHVPPTIHCLKNLVGLNCDGLSRSIWRSLLPPDNIQGSDLGISGLKFGLESLEFLSLKDCNLVEEDIPEDLHYFSSLKTLDLSGNNFVRLPESINHLKNLRELKLNDCFKLQHLPELPTNLEPIISYTESGAVRNFPIPYHHDKHFILEFIPKTNLKLDPKAFEESISEGTLFYSTDDKAEVLECFNGIREGNVIEIEQYQIKNDANNIYGVVLAACIECSQNTPHEVVTFYCKFLVELEMEGNPKTLTLPLTSKLTSRTRFWMLFIPSHMLSESRVSFKIVVKGSLPSVVNVQKCGASVLSRQNASRFLAYMFNKVYHTRKQNKFSTTIRECNHGTKCSCDEPESSIDQYCSTQHVENESDSFSLLKRSLKSILQRTYEEAKDRSLYYFFPQGGPVLSWFRIQQPKDKVAVKLPLDLFREKKWMGLAVFAVFSIPGNSEYVHDHTFNFRITSNQNDRHLMSGASYLSNSFFIPLSLLQSSPQILFVTFAPRHVFPYVQTGLNHFYVSFISIPTRLRVESCGARLVYQHNVEGLINTIMDCVLKSGQELYQDCSQEVLRHFLATYHRPIWIRAPADPRTTSTSSDLSSQHKSSRHTLFMENRYKSKLDFITDGKEIPDFFTSQSMGNKGTVRTPERLYFAKCEVGVLVCAVVVINKPIEKLEGVKVLDLKCEFGVDSHEIEPEHHLFVSTEKLLSRYALSSSFIWVSHIPIPEFNVPWMCCNYLRCKISTNQEELFHVQQCGLHLLYASERKMVDNLLHI